MSYDEHELSRDALIARTRVGTRTDQERAFRELEQRGYDLAAIRRGNAQAVAARPRQQIQQHGRSRLPYRHEHHHRSSWYVRRYPDGSFEMGGDSESSSIYNGFD